jgi:hypothetical protein
MEKKVSPEVWTLAVSKGFGNKDKIKFGSIEWSVRQVLDSEGNVLAEPNRPRISEVLEWIWKERNTWLVVMQTAEIERFTFAVRRYNYIDTRGWKTPEEAYEAAIIYELNR